VAKRGIFSSSMCWFLNCRQNQRALRRPTSSLSSVSSSVWFYHYIRKSCCSSKTEMTLEPQCRSLPIHGPQSLDVDVGVEAQRRNTGWFNRIFQACQIAYILRTALPLITNILAWYATNGMNGIAMQKASVALRKDHPSLFTILANTALITSAQLLLGAILGRFLLYLHSCCKFRSNLIVHTFGFDLLQPAQILLAALHSMGSVSTNLGFMFGSASLVQIIKLMEPFQTLILSKFLSEEGKRITPGIITSMSLTVGAAVSLIKSRPQSSPVLAVFFAVLSGFTLSSRNVIQRHQYASFKATTTAALKQMEEQGQLERALVQFTQISMQSGMLVMTILLPLMIIAPREQMLYAHEGALRTHIDVFLWHPLYNVFSMITLAFCSALTHSLFNAGKRVVAIAMAIVWFKEEITTKNLLGFAATLVGGCWYTCESQIKKSQSSWLKCGPALLVLYFLFSNQWEGMFSII
jgi:hypothetical protein